MCDCAGRPYPLENCSLFNTSGGGLEVIIVIFVIRNTTVIIITIILEVITLMINPLKGFLQPWLRRGTHSDLHSRGHFYHQFQLAGGHNGFY